jgi:hypothetical protein
MHQHENVLRTTALHQLITQNTFVCHALITKAAIMDGTIETIVTRSIFTIA